LEGDRSGEPYSQIIEYEIDEEDMTVRRLWSFGEGERDLYGSRNSGVAYLKTTGNRLLITSGLDETDIVGDPHNPHIIEVTENGEIVFDLEIQGTGLSAYQGGRVSLYHPGQGR
jgi:arylsulfate sulfotransferase